MSAARSSQQTAQILYNSQSVCGVKPGGGQNFSVIARPSADCGKAERKTNMDSQIIKDLENVLEAWQGVNGTHSLKPAAAVNCSNCAGTCVGGDCVGHCQGSCRGDCSGGCRGGSH
jgi:hypothetical protein